MAGEMVAAGSASASPAAAVASPREAPDADPEVSVTAAAPLAPVLAVVAVPSAAPARPSPKLNLTACEHAMQASTCEEARAAQHRCPDAAGALHHRVHQRVSQLCGAHEHATKEAVRPEGGTVGTPTRPARRSRPSEAPVDPRHALNEGASIGSNEALETGG